MNNPFSIIFLLLTLLSFPGVAQEAEPRWGTEQAQQWYDGRPGDRQSWVCGFNYIPANAINYTAMWDKTSFSPDVIDEELTLAEKTGFNTVRVVLQYLVWKDDPKYFKKTFSEFLAICDQHGIKVVPCFFDDCVFGEETDPVLGEQREPREGWYAWAWSPSPGHSRVTDPSTYPSLEKYVKDMLTTYKDDARVLLWDLYNEPTNGGLGDKSLSLVRKVFQWAREADPSQPVSIAYWNDNQELNDIIAAHSDITTFHSYDGKEGVKETIARLKEQGRPMICTEWLNRPRKSTVADILPIFYQEDIGAIHWGFVNGKTQTHLPWGHRPGDPPPNVWQHDLYTSDLTPYAPKELKLFSQYIDKSEKSE